MSVSSMSLADQVFCNSLIVENILKQLIENDSFIMDNLKLRLVSNTFNLSVLRLVRKEHVEIVISPLLIEQRMQTDEESDDEDDDFDGFLLNYRKVNLDRSSNYFKFLNEHVGITVKYLVFEDFKIENNDIHDAIMNDFLKPHMKSIKSFRGAENICDERGCSVCTSLANNCSDYGPVQLNVVFQEIHHFECLTVTEKFLTDIAIICSTQPTKEDFHFTMEKHISPNITCDHLEIMVSDTLYCSLEPSVLPRELIDQMLIKWKVKKVTLTFIRGLSMVDSESWENNSDYLTGFNFTQSFEKTRKSNNLTHLKTVEINLFEAASFGNGFYSHMKGDSFTELPFENLIPNVMRVFPCKEFSICLPFDLKSVILPQMYSFLKTMFDYSWSDVLNCRHSNIYFRVHTDGWIRSIEPEQESQLVTKRPIEVILVEKPSKTWKKFDEWPLIVTDRRHIRQTISFENSSNKSSIHLQMVKTRSLRNSSKSLLACVQ